VSTWESSGKFPCLPKLLFEYINVKPRFYTREQVAQALAQYLRGLSSWRVSLPHSTLLYYFRRLSYVRYVVSLSGVYAIDETNILYCPVYLLDNGVIINVNISNE